MKACIIYTGSYNLADYCLNSHEILFNTLIQNKIQYDVYISVANEIHLKSFEKEGQVRLDGQKSKIRELQQIYHMDEPQFVNPGRCETWKTLDKSFVKEKFENIVGKENIKHIDYINCEDGGRSWDNDYNQYPCNSDRDLHFLEGLFKNNFYKRTLRLSTIIPKEKYDLFIQLRPDFKINFLSLNNIISENKKYFNFHSGRIDFIYFSSFIFTDYLNKTNYENLLNTENKDDPVSFFNLKKNEKYKNKAGQHLLLDYFKKIDKTIDSRTIHIGNKIDSYTVQIDKLL